MQVYKAVKIIQKAIFYFKITAAILLIVIGIIPILSWKLQIAIKQW